SDVGLGSTTTDSLGRYRITLTVPDGTLQARLKTRPDLQVRILSGDTFLAASEIRFNASHNETLDVVLPENASLPSEYETLISAIGAHYRGQLGALQETDDRADITYLAQKTDWDARAVAMSALADQLSETTAPAPSAVRDTGRGRLP